MEKSAPAIDSLLAAAKALEESLKVLSTNLRSEARRVLFFSTRYSGPTKNNIFKNSPPSTSKCAEIQEYSELITVQFCGRLEELLRRVMALRM